MRKRRIVLYSVLGAGTAAFLVALTISASGPIKYEGLQPSNGYTRVSLNALSLRTAPAWWLGEDAGDEQPLAFAAARGEDERAPEVVLTYGTEVSPLVSVFTLQGRSNSKAVERTKTAVAACEEGTCPAGDSLVQTAIGPGLFQGNDQVWSVNVLAGKSLIVIVGEGPDAEKYLEQLERIPAGTPDLSQ